jgi:SNF2 family DNA or RNA helicase
MQLLVQLSPHQRELYRALLEQSAAKLAKETRDGVGERKPATPSLSNVLVKLRQLCNHPYLLEKAEWPMPRLDDARGVSRALDTMVGQSAKLMLLHKLLPKLRAEGRKVPSMRGSSARPCSLALSL